MSKLKDDVINGIIQREGGYSNLKSDRGGATMYGITEAVARASGYQGDMRQLPRDLAYAIYSRQYWDALNLDAIEKLSPLIAAELADTGVNQGVGTAGKYLQRSLNVLNKRSTIYTDIAVDGAVGAGTLGVLKKYLAFRGKPGETVLHRMLNCLQGATYVALAEKNVTQEDFVFGWMMERVV